MKIHVKIQEKIYEVTVGDLQTRPVIASVDGEDFEVWPEEMSIPSDAGTEVTPVSMPGISAIPIEKPVQKSSVNAKNVNAPLPGVIIEIMVKEGDNVCFGQELCVLEAMKMKNTIRSSRTGMIKKICIQVGDQVQHSAELMEFTD
ncbi:MAG TPA: biotin/lipoyl-containing protein [Pelolinea sp.]|nr:biotin/lipoyl-containing protein [Pelolinea sp.]